MVIQDVMQLFIIIFADNVRIKSYPDMLLSQQHIEINYSLKLLIVPFLIETFSNLILNIEFFHSSYQMSEVNI